MYRASEQCVGDTSLYLEEGCGCDERWLLCADPPPEDMTFTMILVMLTVMIAVPLSFLFDIVLESYCKYRPNFALWGYNNENILGRNTQSTASFNKEDLYSTVKILKDNFDSIDKEKSKYYTGKQLDDYNNERIKYIQNELNKYIC